jgi:hypothetical protein
VLAYLRKGETFAELAAGFGVGTATAWRYVTETVALLAARSPQLHRALAAAAKAGHAFVVLDGTLIPIDRVAADRPFYSGKHHKHGMNLQIIASPGGQILWVSGPLPCAVHDLTAARIWGIIRELAACGFITLADKGYIGGGDHVRTRYRGRNKPVSQKAANRAHAQLRFPAERANAQLKNWRILRKLRCCPWRAGQLASGAGKNQSPPGARVPEAWRPGKSARILRGTAGRRAPPGLRPRSRISRAAGRAAIGRPAGRFRAHHAHLHRRPPPAPPLTSRQHRPSLPALRPELHTQHRAAGAPSAFMEGSSPARRRP